MPIRVEHGPNLGAVGQVAYKTGQLEYRNKRRAELERIAMQQAEMRQRAQQQQQSIQATLQGQKMSQMGAMQRLQQQQQFGVINAEQANQQAVKAGILKQENQKIWGKQLGQNQLDLANLNAGLADQKVIKNLQWKQEWDELKRRLNGPGQAAHLKLKQQEAAALADVRGNPAEADDIRAQFRPKYQAVEDDVNNTINVEDQRGWTEPVSRNEAGEVTINQVNMGPDPDTGQQILEYVIQPYRNVEVIDENGGVTTQQIDRTPAEISAIRHIPITIGDQVYVGTHNSKTNGYDIDLNKGRDTPKVEAQKRFDDKMERWQDDTKDWRSDQIKHRANYLSAQATYEEYDDTGDNFPDFEAWGIQNGVRPAPEEPVEPDWAQFDGAQGPAGQVGPVGMGGQQNIEDELSLGDKGRPMAQGTQGVTGAPGEQGMAGQPQATDPNAPAPFMEPEFKLQQESDFADIQPEVPQAPQEPPSEEFKTVPPKYHPKKQYERTYKYDAPEKYDMMNMPINAIDPVDRQAVYEQRQRISKVLPWDSATNGPVSPRSIIEIIKQPDSYGLKIDLSKDTSDAGKLVAEAMQKLKGSSMLVVNKDVMWQLLSPGLSQEEGEQLLDRIYTEKKKHFEFYGEAENFQNDRMDSFMQRVISPGVR